MRRWRAVKVIIASMSVMGTGGQMYSTLLCYSPTSVLPHHTTPPPPNPPLPLTPNTSLLDLTVTYDYRASAVGEGPDKTIEELSAMFAFKVHSIYGSGTENTVRMRSVGLQSVAWQGLVLGFMHSCLCTQDSPVGRPSLLPLCSDLGCSPQLPARKRPRMTLPLSTASPPQQSRFQRLEWLAGQLHQRLSEGKLKVYVLDGFVSQMVSLSP